jgi:hypothetical protein
VRRKSKLSKPQRVQRRKRKSQLQTSSCNSKIVHELAFRGLGVAQLSCLPRCLGEYATVDTEAETINWTVTTSVKGESESR